MTQCEQLGEHGGSRAPMGRGRPPSEAPCELHPRPWAVPAEPQGWSKAGDLRLLAAQEPSQRQAAVNS